MELLMRDRKRSPIRGQRRKKPRVVKGFIRIGAGPAMLYLIAGTDEAVKLQREDVQRLENDSHKMIEEMDKEEFVEAMERLNINSISLTDDEKQMVELASKYVLAGYFILTDTRPS